MMAEELKKEIHTTMTTGRSIKAKIRKIPAFEKTRETID
jgi:hypothetical protein